MPLLDGKPEYVHGYGKSGTGTLTVDGKQSAQGKIERTMPVRVSIDETLDIGEDTGTPVVEDYADKMPFKFTGDLKKVVITPGKSGLGSADKKKLEEVNKKLADVTRWVIARNTRRIG